MPKKPHYVFFPSPAQAQPRDTTKLLRGLGKPTKRGIRRCFKCGIYNGTRSLGCKNKQCGAVFRECSDKQKANLDAIRLASGASRQVFSVRVRDKGPDCRGFVQLPLMQATEKDVALSEVALCFVDFCQRLFDDSILKCHEAGQHRVTPICIHIKSALKSVNAAVPVETQSCTLGSLSFSEDIKRELWLLSTETGGPLVQRVSKTVMAVKCQVTPKHPLGYLHFTFCVIKGKECYSKFCCSCLDFKGQNYVNSAVVLPSEKCIHFYACIWAFASDLRFSDEFIDFLNLELPTNSSFKKQLNGNISSKPHLEKTAAGSSAASNSPNLRKAEHDSAEKFGKLRPTGSSLAKQSNLNSSEAQTFLNFVEWLGSVADLIGQTLSKQDEGVKTLSFHIPSAFFSLLEDRIRSSNEQSNDALCASTSAAGASYLIYSITQLKAIFTTPQATLKVMELIVRKVTLEEQHHSECRRIIKFLKVGSLKSENFSFNINWVPDVLPHSHFGKLELIFNVDCCELVKFFENAC